MRFKAKNLVNRFYKGKFFKVGEDIELGFYPENTYKEWVLRHYIIIVKELKKNEWMQSNLGEYAIYNAKEKRKLEEKELENKVKKVVKKKGDK